MVATTNLNMQHWVASQSQPEVNHNVNLDIVDGKLCAKVTVDHNGDADYTLATTGTSPYEWQHAFIETLNTGTAFTTARNLNVPSKACFYAVYNNNGSAFNIHVQVTGGAGVGVDVAPDEMQILYSDGADVYSLARSSASAGGPTFTVLGDTPGSYTGHGDKQVFVNTAETALEFRTEFRDMVIGFTILGLPTNGQEVLRLTMTHAITFPSGMTGSQSKSGIASTGNVAFSIRKNGVEFATLTYNTTSTGVFAAASSTSLAIGDELIVLAPATADTTLANIGVSLKATRD